LNNNNNNNADVVQQLHAFEDILRTGEGDVMTPLRAQFGEDAITVLHFLVSSSRQSRAHHATLARFAFVAGVAVGSTLVAIGMTIWKVWAS
jgi:hypothetical protein